MLIYIILFILFLIPAIQQALVNKKNILFFVGILLSAILAGVRFRVGNDWPEYVEYYNTLPELDSLKNLSQYRYESLYTILNSLFKTLGFGYQFFFFVFSLITTTVLLYAICKFNKRYLYLSFLIYFSYHFLPYEMNMIRQGIAASWIFLGFYYSSVGDLRKYLLCILVAFLFQSIGILFLPFYWLNRIKWNRKWMLISLGACFFVYLSLDFLSFIDYAPLFQNQINYYATDYYSGQETSSYGITMGLVFNFVVAVFAWQCALKKEYENSMITRVAVNALLYSFIIGIALNNMAIFVERIVGILNMTIIIILPRLIDYFNKRHRFIFLCGIILYCLLFFRATVYTKGGYKDQYQYIPYTYKL